MTEQRRLLILGGTTEAAALARGAAAIDGLAAITSLAGRTRHPAPIPGHTRVGGFGGAEGLEAYLRAERIDWLIDATHPFAALISDHAARACAAAQVPRLGLARPPWEARAGDRWIEVDDPAAAAAALPGLGARVFLTIGRKEIACFAGLTGTWFLIRTVDPPTAPLAIGHATVIQGRGPFSCRDEQNLFAKHRISVLVSRNSGAEATYPKIAAARAAGLPVVMIRPPPAPAGESVASVDAAIDWLRTRMA
ncbi:MAG: cobalt-precorrin-6A reductase [Alphaproteobacteria bacterium]|jgi:precorrin-6A/cobalt-precorrin-6A reductase|nr:cobalt-precorrin-6A reductase [Alphaproteobacteria bacterium]